MAFSTFTGVRLHERKSHPHEEASTKSQTLTESEYLTIIARIEANIKKGEHINIKITEATGLSKDQIRHRRSKPIYKEYLEIARNEKAKAETSPDRTEQCQEITKVLPNSQPALPEPPNIITTKQDVSPPKTRSQLARQKKANAETPLVRAEQDQETPKGLSNFQPTPSEPPNATTKKDVSPTKTRSQRKCVNIISNVCIQPPSIAPPVKPSDAVNTVKPHDDNHANPHAPVYSEPRPNLPVANAPGEHYSQEAGSSRGIPIYIPDDPPSDDDVDDDHGVPAPQAHQLGLAQSIKAAAPDTTKGKHVPGKTLGKSRSAIVPPQPPEDKDRRPNNELQDYLSARRREVAEFEPGASKNKITELLDLVGVNQPLNEIATSIDKWIDTNIACKSTKCPKPVASIRPKAPHYGQSSKTETQTCLNRQAPDSSTTSTKHYGQTFTGNGPRAQRFKKTQDLYAKDRKGLVDRILRGAPLNDEPTYPPIEVTEEYYRALYERNPSDVPPTNIRTGEHNPAGCPPITVAEVKQAKSSWHRSAPGPDGLQVERILTSDDETLATLLSCLLLGNFQLPRAKQARTSLIYKSGNRRDPANWRPITVTSTILRFFHRILAKRISNAVVLSTDQRGFVNIDGTLANCLIVDNYIKTRRADTKKFAIVSVSKAFDTVRHSTVIDSLVRAGIPMPLIRYIKTNMESSSTSIRLGGKYTSEIKLHRGVKQGDPLSPILFNLVVDDLLKKLNTNNPAATIGESTKISAVAFADDILLLADDPASMPLLVRSVEDFFAPRGMALNPNKCHCIAYRREKGKYFVMERPYILIGDALIQQITSMNAFKYLGHMFSASGVLRPSIANLPTWLTNIHSSCLKPNQKLAVIKDFVIPKMAYGLQNSKIDGMTLTSVDRQVRAAVKRVLHLQLHTPDAAIHANIRYGGLGVMETRSQIPLVFKNRLQNLFKYTDDLTLQETLRSKHTTSLIARLEKLVGPNTSTNMWREVVQSHSLLSGIEGAEEDAASRSWINQVPRGWSGRDFVRAVHLRCNNLPTVGIPSNPPERRYCRVGCRKIESIAHVLQQCPLTHHARIRRHNEVARKIANFCRPKHTVEEEPHVRHPNGELFKPDLAIHLGARVLIVDVGVNWEGSVSLNQSYISKREVYNNPVFLEAAARRWPDKDISVEALILGARGIWPQCNSRTSSLLGLTSAVKASCVHSTLKWGSSIHHSFMKTVWRTRGRRRY